MLKKNNLVIILPFLTMYYFNSDVAINFIKNTIYNNNIEEKSILKRITESFFKFQLKEQKDILFKILNMRNNLSFKSVKYNLDIDDLTK